MTKKVGSAAKPLKKKDPERSKAPGKSSAKSSRKDITPKKAGIKSPSSKDSPPAAPTPRRYEKTQREYAEMYGVSLPTVKRWWKAGHPLDDPDQMGEYLSPRGRKPDGGAPAAPWPDPPPPSDVPPSLALAAPDTGADIPINLDETFFRGQGVLAAIERLKKAERERAAAYFDAINRCAPPQLLKNRFGEWIGIIEALRKLEKDAPDIRKANDLSIDRGEMEAAIGQIFQAFRVAANNLPGRAAGKLVGLTDYEEIYTVLEREVEVLLRTLAGGAAEALVKAEAEAPIDDTEVGADA